MKKNQSNTSFASSKISQAKSQRKTQNLMNFSIKKREPVSPDRSKVLLEVQEQPSSFGGAVMAANAAK